MEYRETGKQHKEGVQQMHPRKEAKSILAIIIVDKQFNEIVQKDIKNMIAVAFNDLNFNLRVGSMIPMGTGEITCVKKKACQMKLELNNYIDMQVKNIIEANKEEI